MQTGEIEALFARFRDEGDVAALGDVFDRAAPELLRLATHLAGDVAEAEDLVQGTFLVAIERARAYDASRPLLPWLVGILTRRATRVLRGRARRPDAERVRSAEAVDPAREAERTELAEELHRALATCPDTYRPVLEAHLVEGRRSVEIASDLGRAPGTVRMQLMRGLELLRRALPAGLAGGALVELGGRGLAAVRESVLDRARAGPGPVFAATSSSGILGGALVSLKTTAFVAAAVAAGVAAYFVLAPHNEGPLDPLTAGSRQTGAQIEVASGEEGAEAEQRTAAELAPDPAPARKKTDTWSLAIERASGRLDGRVLETGTGAAVPAAAVRARAYPGALHPGLGLAEDRTGATQETSTDAGGTFRFDDLPAGPYELEVRDAGGRTVQEVAAVTSGGAFVQLWLGAEANSDLRVFVFDRSQAPVPGARVTLRGSGASDRLRGEGQTTGWTELTDELGRAVFRGAGLRRGLLIAHGPDGGVARADFFREDDIERKLRGIPDGRGGLELGIGLELSDAGAIEGRVADGGGTLVRAWARSWHRETYASTRVPFETRADQGGAFRIEGLAPGTYDMTAEAPAGKRLVLAWKGGPLSGLVEYEPVRVEVRAGSSTFVELKLATGPLLEGRVTRSGDGAPITGARSLAVLPQGLTSDPDRVLRGGVPLWRFDGPIEPAERSPTLSAEARTDADGRYRIAGLQPGRDWRVEVFAGGLSYDRRQEVELTDGETTRLDHVLELAGGIQGVAQSWASLGLRRAGEERFLLAFIAPRRPLAPFAIPGLAPGEYEITALHSEEDRPPTPFITVAVRAGELTWVDLTRASPNAVEGRVLLRGRPVAGAILSFFGPQVVTGEDGKFVWHYPFVHESLRGFDLAVPSEPEAPALRVEVPGMCTGRIRSGWDIHLPEGRIEIEVVDESGSPLAAFVTLESLRGEEGGMQSLGLGRLDPEAYASGKIAFSVLPAWSRSSSARRGTDPAGRIAYDLLPAGRYLVRAELILGEPLPPLEVTLSEGETAQRSLARLPGGVVEVLVQDRDGTPQLGREVALSIQHSEETFSTLKRRTNAEGLARFEGVPAGAATAFLPVIFAPTVDRVELQVLAGETTRVTVRQAGDG